MEQSEAQKMRATEIIEPFKGHKVHLRWPDMVILAVIGLAPAGGYGAWAWTTNERIARIETREEAKADMENRILDIIEKHSETLPALLTQQKDIERRLDRLEWRNDKNSSKE